MRVNDNKKNLISVLAIIFALCLCLFFSGLSNTERANADGGFYMNESVSVRTDRAGIRFSANFNGSEKIDADKFGYGFLVFPHSYLENLSGYYKDLHNDLPRYVDIKGDKQKIYQGTGANYISYAAFLEVYAEDYDLPFTCVAYTLNAAGEYQYADFEKDFGISLYQAVSNAYLDGVTDRAKLNQIYSEYGIGTNERPVLIEEQSQLNVLSADVAAGQTFDGVYFKLVSDITLDGEFTPVPSSFGGVFDGNGKTVRGTDSAVLIEGKTYAELNYEGITDEDFYIPRRYLVINSANWSQDNSSNIFNASVEDGIATSAQISALGFTGEYFGAAIKWTVNEGSGDWYFKNTYSNLRLDNIGAEYDYLRFFVAVDDSCDAPWNLTLSGGLIQKAIESTDGKFTFNENNAGVWQSFCIPVKDFVSTAKENSLINFIGGVSISQNGLTTMEGKVDLYISGFEFYTHIPAENLIAVTEWAETERAPVYNLSLTEKTRFVAAENLNFAGDYAGNAVEVSLEGNSVDTPFYFDYTFTENQIEVMRTEYNYVHFYLAVKDLGGDSGWNLGLGGNLMNFARETDSSGSNVSYYNFNADNAGRWVEFNILLEDFNKYVKGNSSHSLFSVVSGSGYDVKIYISEISFVIKNSVLTIDQNTLALGELILPSEYPVLKANTSFVANEDLPDALKEGYAGNAIKWSYLFHHSVTFGISHGYTQERLEEMCNSYSTVKIRLAMVINSQDGKVYTSAGEAVSNWYYIIYGGLVGQSEQIKDINYPAKGTQYSDGKPVPTINFNQRTYNQWLELTMSAYDFYSFVGGGESFDLFTRWWINPTYSQDNCTANSNLDLYFGDITFED